MGDRVELQKKIDALKKLNNEQLVNIAKEGRYMGTKFESLELDVNDPSGSNVKAIAYKIQDAMGLGSDKAKNNEAASKTAPATKKTTATKKPVPVKESAGDRSPLLGFKEQLKAEKEKGKVALSSLKAKHKEDLAKAAEKLKEEKGKAKEAMDALRAKGKEDLEKEKGKGKEAIEKLKEKTGKDLSRLQLKLDLSSENEKRLADQVRRSMTLAKINERGLTTVTRSNSKLKTDLAKGIKFLEKLI